MGDRGNVVICDGEDKVYLYTHWERIGQQGYGEIVGEEPVT